MRVLYVSEQMGPHDRRFLAAILAAGHQASFACVGRQTPAQVPQDVEVVVGPLDQAIIQARPDLVHAGPLHSGAYLAARTGFHPLVAMSWGSDILYTAQRDPFARRRVAAALKGADALIADCEAVASAATGLRFPHRRISVFPWGVDLAQFKPGPQDGLRQRLGWQDAFVLLHLRAWEPIYGAETVLRAFLDLVPTHPRLRLLMPGDGRLKVRFMKRIQSSRFADRVHLPGKLSQEELPAYYRNADLYLSASHSDGSSVSLMEALACGLPALVSDIPANREWVRPDIEGWLFPTGDATALADKIVEAMHSKDLQALGQNARRMAEARADWRTNQLGIAKAYELALSA